MKLMLEALSEKYGSSPILALHEITGGPGCYSEMWHMCLIKYGLRGSGESVQDAIRDLELKMDRFCGVPQIESSP